MNVGQELMRRKPLSSLQVGYRRGRSNLQSCPVGEMMRNLARKAPTSTQGPPRLESEA